MFNLHCRAKSCKINVPMFCRNVVYLHQVKSNVHWMDVFHLESKNVSLHLGILGKIKSFLKRKGHYFIINSISSCQV